MRIALVTIAALALPATLMAATPPPSAPAEVAALAPAGTKLVAFKSSGDTDGADAVAVFENESAGAARQRDMLILHKQAGRFQLVDRNDNVIACSTCGQLRDDPFDPNLLKVTPGHISLIQAHGGETPSESNYAFAYDAASSKWRVVSAKRKDVADQGDGAVTNGSDPLPSSGLFKDFDGRWKATSLWNGYVVNDSTHRFSQVVNKPTEAALDKAIAEACSDGAACHVLLKQENGCMSLVKDSAQAFYAAGTAGKHSKSQALGKATAACEAKGHGGCEEQTSYCAIGFR